MAADNVLAKEWINRSSSYFGTAKLRLFVENEPLASLSVVRRHRLGFRVVGFGKEQFKCLFGYVGRQAAMERKLYLD